MTNRHTRFLTTSLTVAVGAGLIAAVDPKIVPLAGFAIFVGFQAIEGAVGILFKGWTFSLFDGVVILGCLVVAGVVVALDESTQRKA